ncbi:MAG: hypothetical protein V8Q36_06760 [Anaerotignum sp.]
MFADSHTIEEFIREQALADLDLYLTKLQSAQTVGTEEINGVSATVVTGILDGKDMADSGEEWAIYPGRQSRCGDPPLNFGSRKMAMYCGLNRCNGADEWDAFRCGPEAEPVDYWSYGEYVEQMTYGDFHAAPHFENPAESAQAA